MVYKYIIKYIMTHCLNGNLISNFATKYRFERGRQKIYGLDLSGKNEII